MSWIFNRTGKGSKKSTLVSVFMVAVFSGCATGYAVNTTFGIWAGVFWGIIMLLSPLTILGIYYMAELLSDREEEK